MPFYVATIDSPLSPSEVWARVSDVSRFAEWDPGTLRSVQVAGSGPGPDAAYLLTVKGVPRPLDLRYTVTRFEAPERLALEADTGVLRSADEISLTAAGAGTRLTYRAELSLHGVWRVATPVLGLAFGRIGRQAEDGLRAFLAGG